MITMFEPDVTITDLFIVAECAYFSHLFYKNRYKHELYFWFFVYFASISGVALLGAVYHGMGFGYDKSSAWAYWLWKCVLLGGGLSGLSFWMLGKSLRVSRARVSVETKMIAALACLMVVLTGISSFLLIAAACIPGFIFFVYGLISRYFIIKKYDFLLCMSALVLLIVASLMQFLGVCIHDRFFNHNATYHVVIIISHVLLFCGGQGIAGTFAQETHKA